MADGIGELPQPKSLAFADVPMGGDMVSVVARERPVCGVMTAGPLSAHVSLEPHASALERGWKLVLVAGADD